MSAADVEFDRAEELLWLYSHLRDITYKLDEVMPSLLLLGETDAHAYVLRSLVGLNKLSNLIRNELETERTGEQK